ncbi:Uncharacterized protein Fot_21421 [Forsythia ovata]|uniref:Uncharacterized protein n=1 Tax=Forsythia ovata TaxID=205694 RepID=A0ABD1UUS7_9LAMI
MEVEKNTVNKWRLFFFCSSNCGYFKWSEGQSIGMYDEGKSSGVSLDKSAAKYEIEDLSRIFKVYGLLEKKFKDTFGHGGAILSDLVGMKKANNHGVPYSLTEEFVGVYRMHSLLPDTLLLRNVDAAPGPNRSPPLEKQYVSFPQYHVWHICYDDLD